MREIKFRAWDKVGKEMFYSYPRRWENKTSKETSLMTMDLEQFVVGFNGGLYILDECGRYEDFDDHEYELMQFTGLHDKNGKEIYERDILGCEFGNVEVKWEVQGWSPFVDQEKTQWEVIGNIYENPELLKP